MRLRVDNVSFIFGHIQPDGSFRKEIHSFGANRYQYDSYFADGTLDETMTRYYKYAYQDKLFKELMERVDYVLDQEKDEACEDKFMFCIEGEYECKRYVAYYNKQIYEVDPLLANIFKRMMLVNNIQSNYKIGTPIGNDTILDFEAEDIEYLMYTENPDMETGDELYIATKEIVYYTPIETTRIYSQQKVIKIFPKLKEALSKALPKLVGEITLNNEEFIYAAISEKLRRVVLIKKSLFLNGMMQLLKVDRSDAYISMVNYIAWHSDVPSDVVYRFQNY